MRGLRQAIDHAATHGAQVVSISLGGPFPGFGTERAIRRAFDVGTIVLAAAGNEVGLVVFPAAFEDVIAVAASNVRDQPWTGSSHGPAVDITAPGESVWRAQTARDSPPATLRFTVERGNGTSFAVATTAGVAALWVSFHGWTNLVRRFGAGNIARVFKQLLQATCRTPRGWDTAEFGPGIVDAKTLLAEPLPATAPARKAPAMPDAPPIATDHDRHRDARAPRTRRVAHASRGDRRGSVPHHRSGPAVGPPGRRRRARVPHRHEPGAAPDVFVGSARRTPHPHRRGRVSGADYSQAGISSRLKKRLREHRASRTHAASLYWKSSSTSVRCRPRMASRRPSPAAPDIVKDEIAVALRRGAGGEGSRSPRARWARSKSSRSAKHLHPSSPKRRSHPARSRPRIETLQKARRDRLCYAGAARSGERHASGAHRRDHAAPQAGTAPTARSQALKAEHGVIDRQAQRVRAHAIHRQGPHTPAGRTRSTSLARSTSETTSSSPARTTSPTSNGRRRRAHSARTLFTREVSDHATLLRSLRRRRMQLDEASDVDRRTVRGTDRRSRCSKSAARALTLVTGESAGSWRRPRREPSSASADSCCSTTAARRSAPVETVVNALPRRFAVARLAHDARLRGT